MSPGGPTGGGRFYQFVSLSEISHNNVCSVRGRNRALGGSSGTCRLLVFAGSKTPRLASLTIGPRRQNTGQWARETGD